jgi:hypothetical protein
MHNTPMDIGFLNKEDLLKTKKSLKITIGKLHAIACAHRIKKDCESMRDIHRVIERYTAEIRECEYLIELIKDNERRI